MNAHEFAELRDRLAAFQLDDPEAAYPFSARLARENGWSRAYALRVVEEYKRFVLLCQLSDRPPCPSEQVDEAWHMHLTFTRSYWTQLCGRVLGRPLHHEPTRGGAEEHDKHVVLYEHTLALYRATFEAEPPRDIWPPASIRFGADTEHRKVNLARNWVIPNPFARLFESRASFTTVSVALPLAVAAWNPLDWQGPAFLALFGVCYLVALFLGLALRKALPPQSFVNLDPPLSPLELAQLARGKRGAITATLSQLVTKDVLQLQETEVNFLGLKVQSQQKLVGGTANPTDPLEKALAKAILANPNANLKQLNEAAGDTLDRTEAELVNRGLVYEPQDVFFARLVPVALVGLVLLLGLSKIVIGLSRERPVVFLILGCVVAAVTLFYFARNIRRTKAGDELVEDLQAKHVGWKTGGQTAGLSAADVPLAVALFGTAALAGSDYAPLNHWERQSFGNVSDYSGGGCGSGCGGGGGGCGGGGCGGGGCGGCGGG